MTDFIHSRWQPLKGADADYLLADQVRQGDPVAFDVLVEKYHKPIINFASRFLGDPIEAHDVAQNVFVQVFKLASDFHNQSKFSTWLYAIARNLCRNEYRRRVRQRTELLDLVRPDHRSIGRLKSQDPRYANIPEALLEAELQQKIEESVASLPRKQRTAILLLLKQDLSYEEVALNLGTSVSAIKGLIHRARQRLKEKLQPYLRTGAWV
jgi:RNA polymerase sigma-70 factor (ECF subfamily)